MLLPLLAKDLRRAWRNPTPWLVWLAAPLLMTALIGLAFGGRSENGSLGRIRFAVVDEDQSLLGDALRGAASRGEGAKYLDPVFLGRQEALGLVNDNKISAVLIVPEHFTRDYLQGAGTVSLELIKNPAESIHPAVIEELLGVAVAGMNAVSRNFNSEFPEWREVLEGRRDYHAVAALIDKTGGRLQAVRHFIDPPLVTYDRPENAQAGSSATNSPTGGPGSAVAGKAGKAKGRDMTGIFAYLLIGLSGMFLLFLANTGMLDLQHEIRKRTLERFRTVRQDLSPFIAGKVIFTVVLLSFCSAILLGGGGAVFGIHWQRPAVLAVLSLAYAAFAAALFAVLVALVPDERRAGALNMITGMALGCAGGCTFPTEQLPAFIRDHLTPLLPSNWFVAAARASQFGDQAAWGWAAVKLTVAAVVCGALATVLFRRRFFS